MNEWRSVMLSDVADLTVGHVGSMASEYQASGIPWLRSQNVKAHSIDLEDVKYVGEEFHKRLSKSALRPGDVVTVRTGKPGTTAVIPDDLLVSNCSDLVITRPGPDVDSQWLSYYMNSAATGYVSAQLVGAVQQHFNVGSARTMQLKLPSAVEQTAIVEVLGALDDKIAANRKLTETASDLAEALTRESVEAGWTSGLTQIADVVMGSSPAGASLNEGGRGTVFYQGVRDFGFRFPKRRIWTEQVTRVAEAGDTLLSVRAPVGRVNLASEPICIGRGLAAIRTAVGAPATLFNLLKAFPAVWEPFEAEGTIFGSINRGQLEEVQLPIVKPGLAAELESRLAGLEGSIASALAENNLLAELRDTLLPELMSGRLRVKDAEKKIEEVV
jgi:type I restriction enzyme S subunit